MNAVLVLLVPLLSPVSLALLDVLKDMSLTADIIDRVEGIYLITALI